MRAWYILLILAAACDGPPPVKNAHGERIKSVELLEEFASSSDPREVSFRGAISGLGFASCEFTRHQARAALAHAERETTGHHAHASAQPLGLRPSIAENK